MSRSFYLTPAVPPTTEWPSIGLALASAMAARFLAGDEEALNDGALLLDHADRPWFEGIVAGGGAMAEDAASVLAAIDQHGTIRLTVER